MKLWHETRPFEGKQIYRLEVTEKELVNVKLHPFDRDLHASCMETGKISDQVLWLETLTRRIEEAYAREAVETGQESE